MAWGLRGLPVPLAPSAAQQPRAGSREPRGATAAGARGGVEVGGAGRSDGGSYSMSAFALLLWLEPNDECNPITYLVTDSAQLRCR